MTQIVEAIRRKLFSKKNQTPDISETFSGTTLHSQEINNCGRKFRIGLPFDIKVLDDGFTLTRQGERFKEDEGIRIFIIDNKSLDNLYKAVNKKKDVTPDLFYKFLKMYERRNGNLGRYLAISKDGEVKINGEKFKSGYTIIVKKIDRPTKEKFRIPDEARYRFEPGVGFNEQMVERLIPWFKEKQLNITKAITDVETLSIKEHYEQPGLMEFYRLGGLKDEEIIKIFGQHDQKNGLFRTNRNVLLIKSLRENMGSVPAPQIDIDYYKNKNGILMTRIDKKSGVNGITVNGVEYFLDNTTGFLEIPLNTGKNITNIKYWYNFDIANKRRGALEINLSERNGQIMADFVSGINEIEIPAYSASAGIISNYSDSAIFSKDNTSSLRKEMAEIGGNISLFNLNENPKQKKFRAFQEGDEKRLADAVSEEWFSKYRK